MDKEKVVSLIDDLLAIMSLRRIVLLILLLAGLLGCWVMYENRVTVFSLVYRQGAIAPPAQWTLSNESKNQLIALTANELIGGVVVSEVDLKKNRRVTKYMYVKDPIIAEQIRVTFQRVLPQALFDYDPKNTDQMVSMLNNEFKCVPSIDTVNYRFFPKLAETYPITCRMAVPPFLGEFMGYLTIVLTRQLKQNEYDSIRLELNRVAIEIYLRDAAKK